MLPDIDWQNVGIAVSFSLVVAFIVAQFVARLVRFAMMKMTTQDEQGHVRESHCATSYSDRQSRGIPVDHAHRDTAHLGRDGRGPHLWAAAGNRQPVVLRIRVEDRLDRRSRPNFATRTLSMLVQRFEILVAQRAGADLAKIETAERVRTLGGLIRNANHHSRD